MANEDELEAKSRHKDCYPNSALSGLSICLTMILATTLGCLGGVSYFVYLHITNETKYTCPGCPEILSTEIQCKDPQCILSSAEINEFIDDQVDPCEDFHGFVCGRFMQTAYEKQISNPLEAQHRRLRNQINRFIIEPELSDDPHSVKIQKRYFQACLNEEKMHENKNVDFVKLINKLGGSPLLKGKEWKSKDYDWIKNMITAREMGIPFDWFLNIDIYEDVDSNYLKIVKPKDCENFGKNMYKLYLALNTQFAKSTRGPSIHAINKTYVEIFIFEQKLAEICILVKDETATKVTVLDLEELWRRIGNKKFITNITGLNDYWQLDSVVVHDRDYLIRLNHLLRNTDKEVQANYIVWRLMQYFAPYLSETVREIYMEQTEHIDRFQFCLTDTNSKFSKVSETEYIRKFTSPAIKEAGQQLVSSIKQELLNQIKTVSWMSNDTKEAYLDCFGNIETVVGGLDVVFEDTIFSEYLYTGKLSFSSFNIVKMILEWSKFSFATKMETIGKPNQKRLLDEVFKSNIDFEIKFISDQNFTAIVLPAGMFHGVTYNIGRPQYLNYGSLGTLIAEKIVEGTGLPCATTFNYENYEKIKKCLTQSLESINSELGIDEAIIHSNFADFMGRNIAYRAYQKFVEENGEEIILASNKTYSPNQLFWMKSSMNWCYQQLLPNENSAQYTKVMFMFRIIETVRNSLDFVEDFTCKKDVPMNPAQKCIIF